MPIPKHLQTVGAFWHDGARDDSGARYHWGLYYGDGSWKSHGAAPDPETARGEAEALALAHGVSAAPWSSIKPRAPFARIRRRPGGRHPGAPPPGARPQSRGNRCSPILSSGFHHR